MQAKACWDGSSSEDSTLCLERYYRQVSSKELSCSFGDCDPVPGIRDAVKLLLAEDLLVVQHQDLIQAAGKPKASVIIYNKLVYTRLAE